MTDDLYQETLIARARSGREKNRLPSPDGTATLDNPVCGDRVTIDVSLAAPSGDSVDDGAFEGAIISAIGHEVRGCMLCEAAVAMIAAYGPGMTVAAMRDQAESVRAMIKDGAAPPAEWPDIQAFVPVHTAKTRHTCVLLPFDALASGLAQAGFPPPDRTNDAVPNGNTADDTGGADAIGTTKDGPSPGPTQSPLRSSPF